MKKYELMTLTKGSQGEMKAKELSKEVVELIKSLGGKIEDADFWGKRTLAYKLEQETDGYYEVVNLELPKEKMTELKKKLNLKDNLVRYLITAQS
jgi:small subunit ribosomal protein S6